MMASKIFMQNTLYPILLVMMVWFLSCEEENRQDEKVRPRGRTVEPTHIVEIFAKDYQEPVAKVHVALAQTERERNTGLMNVYEMPFDTGMYFIFDDEAPRSFWMVNTPLPLDILFINSDHEIVRIHTRTTPFSDRRIPSEYPAQYVLEVNAGFVGEYDIRESMRVILK